MKRGIKRLTGGLMTCALLTGLLPTVGMAAHTPQETGAANYLQTEDHIAYINGYPDGTMRPNGKITRAETAKMFYGLLRDTSGNAGISFSDVESGKWYAAAVKTLASKNVINGYPNGTFKPQDAITRAEFVTIAMRLSAQKEGTAGFSDVPSSYWAAKAISSAASYGWINGYKDGTFKPHNAITRAEAVTIINRMLGRTADSNYLNAHAKSVRQFRDMGSRKVWYYGAVAEATTAHDHSGSGSNETWTTVNYAPDTTERVYLNTEWEFAQEAAIKSGYAVLYRASSNRKNIVIGVNAGHGTSGGTKVKTWCHPDHSAKVTGGTTAAGAYKAYAVSGGMQFPDGTSEQKVTLKQAQLLKNQLLSNGYDVLMLRDGDDVQLDNVARSVIANNAADCQISLHWDDDGSKSASGAFYVAPPSKLKNMYPISQYGAQHNALGKKLIEGLRAQGVKTKKSGSIELDLTQTSYSTVPSVVMEMGNQYSSHSDSTLNQNAAGLLKGIRSYFG